MKQDMKSLITRYDCSSGERDGMQSDRETNGGGLVDGFTIFEMSRWQSHNNGKKQGLVRN